MKGIGREGSGRRGRLLAFCGVALVAVLALTGVVAVAWRAGLFAEGTCTLSADATPYHRPAGWTAPARAAIDGTTAGFDWEQAAAPNYRLLMAVPTGYVLLRYSSFTVYTSRDGATWQTPPDPGVFVSHGWGWTYEWPGETTRPVLGPAGYVVLAPDPLEAAISTDGIHWREVGTSGLTIGMPTHVVGANDRGYFAYEPHDNYWYASADGVRWAPAEPEDWQGMRVDGPIVAAAREGAGAQLTYWASADGGTTWVQARPPDGGLSPYPVRIGGGYLDTTRWGGPVTSSDLVNWSRVTGLPFESPVDIVAIGGRVFALAGENLWTTSDGLTWERVVGNDGRAIVGQTLQVQGGRLMVGLSPRTGSEHTADGGATLLFVGTPSTAPRPPLVATPNTALPTVPVTQPSASPVVVPCGGIPRADAIRIAAAAAYATQGQVETAYGTVIYGDPDVASVDPDAASVRDRWIWHVTFDEFSAGAFVDVDYYSGRVLHVALWVA